MDSLAALTIGQFERLEERMRQEFERADERMDKKIETLAIQVAKAFEHVDKKFEGVQEDLLEIKTKVSSLDREVSSLKHRLVYREDFDDLAGRVKYLERKMGIVSGK